MNIRGYIQSVNKNIIYFSPLKEIICTLIAGFSGAPGGIIGFLPVYHPLHDIYKLHSETTFFILFAVFLLIIWSADRVPRINIPQDSKHRVHWTSWILISHLLLHYSLFWSMAVFWKPENEIAIGLKERVGPCDEYVPIHTAFGMVNIYETYRL